MVHLMNLSFTKCTRRLLILDVFLSNASFYLTLFSHIKEMPCPLCQCHIIWKYVLLFFNVICLYTMCM